MITVLDPAGLINLLSCGSYVMGTGVGVTGGFTSFFDWESIPCSEKGFLLPLANHFNNDNDDDDKDDSFDDGGYYDY